MKKTVSFLVASFLITSVYAADKKIVVASAAPMQAKPVVVKAKAAEKAHDYALESFGCCGLPQ